MKNLSLFLICLVLSVFTFAQSSNSVPNQATSGPKHGNILPSKIIKSTKSHFHNQASQSKSSSRWYNYAFEVDELLGNIGTSSANFIFPDTTINVSYGSTIGTPWIHGIGVILDPTSDWFNSSQPSGTMLISKLDSFQLDSIGFYCFYDRNLGSTITDTLVIQYRITPSTYQYWIAATSSWVSTNYGTDTLMFKSINHDISGTISTNYADNYATIKLPLTATEANDTLANGLNFFKINIPNGLNVPAGNVIDASFTFIPGYTWTAGVDLLANKNTLRFISMEENGDNGGLGTYPSYIKGDWNSSQILPTSWKHTYNNYYPEYGYAASYGYENHWIEFKLTSNAGTTLPTIYTLTVTPDSIPMGGLTDSTTITIVTDTAWTLSCPDTWLTFSQTSGSGNTTVKVYYTTNPSSTASRNSNITITSAAAYLAAKVIPVHQLLYVAPPHYLSLSPLAMPVPYTSGSFVFNIDTDTAWTLTCLEPWFSTNKTSGTGAEAITVNYLQNPDTIQRIGGIRVVSEASATLQEDLIIIQSPLVNSISNQEYISNLEIFPNPFSELFTIQYSLQSSSHVVFHIYTISGEKIGSKEYGIQTSGEHKISYNGTKLPIGIYVYSIEVNGKRTYGKIVKK